MGYRDGFGTTRSVKKVYLWESGGEGGRRARGGSHHPLATSSPPSSSSPSPPSSSPSPPPPASYIYRTWGWLLNPSVTHKFWLPCRVVLLCKISACVSREQWLSLKILFCLVVNFLWILFRWSTVSAVSYELAALIQPLDVRAAMISPGLVKSISRWTLIYQFVLFDSSSTILWDWYFQ